MGDHHDEEGEHDEADGPAEEGFVDADAGGFGAIIPGEGDIDTEDEEASAEADHGFDGFTEGGLGVGGVDACGDIGEVLYGAAEQGVLAEVPDDGGDYGGERPEEGY